MVIVILVIVFLFFWALIHGGTWHNEYYDDYWG